MKYKKKRERLEKEEGVGEKKQNWEVQTKMEKSYRKK